MASGNSGDLFGREDKRGVGGDPAKDVQTDVASLRDKKEQLKVLQYVSGCSISRMAMFLSQFGDNGSDMLLTSPSHFGPETLARHKELQDAVTDSV